MKKLIALSFFLYLLAYSCDSKKGSAKISDQIRINQLGFYPPSVKQFTIVNTEATEFKLVDAYKNKVYAGELQDQGIWDASGEKVLLGDFSSFTAPGAYYVVVNDTIASYPFKIKNDLHCRTSRFFIS